ncbi:MAG: aldo/keto reductase [Phormidesmis sp.]
MQYRRFGKTDLLLPLLSLGTMRFDSADIAQATISAALAEGVNHLETAPAYGASERYIGQTLAALGINHGSARAQLVITSKLTPKLDLTRDKTADQISSTVADAISHSIEASLQRLETGYLDCIAVHGINTPEHLIWVQDYMLEPLLQAQADGLVRHIGFSTHGSLEVILGAIATQSFAFVNLHYSYFFQRNARAIAQAHQQDMGVFIISPADKAGLLYTPPARLKALCAPYDPLLLNYRWLLSDPRVTTLSIGPATPAELNWPLQIADSDRPLDAAERAAIERLDLVQVESLGSDRCAGCHQCLPCPEAINIPEVLRLRNLALAYDMQAFGQYRYGMFENAGHWFPGRKANRCTDCGDCLPRCPEQLNIPTLLRDTHQRLSGRQRRRLWED